MPWIHKIHIRTEYKLHTSDPISALPLLKILLMSKNFSISWSNLTSYVKLLVLFTLIQLANSYTTPYCGQHSAATNCKHLNVPELIWCYMKHSFDVIYWNIWVRWCPFRIIATTHLISIPVWLKAIIFGAKWFRTEWKPSNELVWESGDACLIPFFRLILFKASFTLSWTAVSVQWKEKV